MKTLRLTPAWDAEGETLRHTWAGLGNIDQFRWFTRKDCLDQLRMAHDEIGLRHVRAVGMFDDELRVMGNDPTRWRMEKSLRGPRANWQIVDYVIESLLDIGVKPVFTTTFTPQCMASGPETVFTTRANISLPKDLAEWERFVTGAVRHAIHRFGLAEVRNWYFEVWNEPNLKGFFAGEKEDFFRLWQRTHAGIKAADAELRIGGPSTARGEWLRDTLEWTRANGCEPDFMITHCYNNDSENGALSPFDGPQEDKCSNSPHFTSGVIRGARKVLDDLGFRGELHFNEWGRSWHPCDYVRESENEAAFIVKTMAEVSQLADYFAYWCLSDIYDQVGYGAETFHGNYGMLNLQGIRKPSWHAHALLNKLGGRRIKVGVDGEAGTPGVLAARGKNSAQVLVYDYRQDDSTMTPLETKVSLPVAGDKVPGVRLWRLSAAENNAPAYWREMNAPQYLRREERLALAAASCLQESKDAVKMEKAGGGYEAVFQMPRPGVALLEIEQAS